MQPDSHPRDRLRRVLSLNDATMLIVASVVGSGIFLTPGGVAALVPHPGVYLAAWMFGGLLSLAGALANAELGAMYPRAGGDYVYLREAFHPLAGFLIGWLSFFVIYTGTIATLAVAFVNSVAPSFGLGPEASTPLAIAVTLAVSAVNYVGVRWGARVNNLTSYAKIAALLAFAALGPLLGRGDAANLLPVFAGASATSLPALGLAFSPILFSYLGWNASVYVASEIERPERNIPASLFLGLGICTLLYMIVNAVYLYALPVDVLSGEPNAGAAAARALFGPVAGSLVAGFVVISILGTLNATVLVGPRIAYAMALDRLFPGGVDRAHARFGTPHRAILLQALVAAALIAFLETFQRVLDATTFAIVLASIADVLALFALRRRHPDRRRPYRALGYPWVPALYVLASAAIAIAMLAGQPLECAVGLACLAAGLPFYWLFTRPRAGSESAC
ncbi:MAG TPA: amino acid permease [Myxococcota bacterium]|jgi:APA family basic amino acid/polyamine antiporter